MSKSKMMLEAQSKSHTVCGNHTGRQ